MRFRRFFSDFGSEFEKGYGLEMVLVRNSDTQRAGFTCA